MPEISRSYGIVIAIYYNDHPPAHFNAKYAERKAKLDVQTGEVLEGELPRRVIALVNEWRQLHVDDLMRAWDLIRARQPFDRIEPLE